MEEQNQIQRNDNLLKRTLINAILILFPLLFIISPLAMVYIIWLQALITPLRIVDQLLNSDLTIRTHGGFMNPIMPNGFVGWFSFILFYIFISFLLALFSKQIKAILRKKIAVIILILILILTIIVFFFPYLIRPFL